MLLVMQFDASVRLQWMEDRPKKMRTTVILSPASYFVSVGCSHEADGLRRFQAPIFEVYIYSNPILIYIYNYSLSGPQELKKSNVGGI